MPSPDLRRSFARERYSRFDKPPPPPPPDDDGIVPYVVILFRRASGESEREPSGSVGEQGGVSERDCRKGCIKSIQFDFVVVIDN